MQHPIVFPVAIVLAAVVASPSVSPAEDAFPDSLVPAKAVPRYTARRCSVAPVIDGKLDDEAWNAINKTDNFVDLITGAQTIHGTRAAITWDDQNLYVGFWVEEPDVQAKYKNRDDPIYYDNDVEVFIAGKDSYYELEVNAFGTFYEAFFVWKEYFFYIL